MSALDSLQDVRKLIILKTIVEAGSMRRAASRLKVTPSAISQSLSSLEKQLGKSMIIRDRGQFRITVECREILERSKLILEKMDEFSLKTAQPSQMSRLDLGTFESFGQSLLPRFISALKADHPDVKLNIVVARSALILQKIRSGELCTGLVTETDSLDGFETEEVFQDELGVFVAADSLKSSSDLDSSLFDRLGLGVISAGIEGYPRYYTKFMNSLGRPKPSIVSDSYEVLRNTAIHNKLIVILPKRVGLRGDNALTDITGYLQRDVNESGNHRIVIAYMEKCDPDEAKYLAHLIRNNS